MKACKVRRVKACEILKNEPYASHYSEDTKEAALEITEMAPGSTHKRKARGFYRDVHTTRELTMGFREELIVFT